MTTVVKLGGHVAAAAHEIAEQLAAIDRLVVVHGGGPQTTALQRRLGQEPRIVSGRRITDDATLDAVKMVVGGKLNIDLCAALLAAGAKPIGLHGASSKVLAAKKRPPRVYPGSDGPVDLGLVGDIYGVNHALLTMLMDAGHTPVLACIGADDDGSVYNINADVVANDLAIELGADALMLVSDVPGVLRDPSDPATRIAEMTFSEAQALIEEGVISGGMIPKVNEAFRAIDRGVKRVHICAELAAGTVLLSG